MYTYTFMFNIYISVCVNVCIYACTYMWLFPCCFTVGSGLFTSHRPVLDKRQIEKRIALQKYKPWVEVVRLTAVLLLGRWDTYQKATKELINIP